MYLTRREIIEAIEAHQAGDTEPMGRIITLIGDGVTKYLHGQSLQADRDEVIQEAAIAILPCLSKIDPTKGNPFSYLTTVVINRIRYQARNRATYRRLLAGYGATLSEDRM